MVASSPDAAEAFIDFCAIEAAAILRPREHIVRALTAELIQQRTGAAVDAVIREAVAHEAVENEKRRRRDWQRAMESARRFAAIVRP